MMALPEEDLRYQQRQVVQQAFNALQMDDQGKVLAAILSGKDGGPQVLFQCEVSRDWWHHPLGQISYGNQTVNGKPFLLVRPDFGKYATEDGEE